jgi:iron complex outermembrane receptor protein
VLLYTSTPASPRAAYVFDSDRLNYTVNASYKIPGPMQSLVYAKIGTGYRAGGVNARTSSPAAPNPFMSTYDNEDTTSYEVGFKGNLARNIYARVSAYLSHDRGRDHLDHRRLHGVERLPEGRHDLQHQRRHGPRAR